MTETATTHLPDYQREWIDTVDDVYKYTNNTGELGGLDFGFDQLNEAFNGLAPAVYHIAGPSNVGKSAFCLQLAHQVADTNNNAYVLYFALDDRAHDMIPRIISMDQRVPISCIKYPKKYEGQDKLLARRLEGFRRTKQIADKFKLRDLNWGDTIEYIESTIQEHKMLLPRETTLCIFIDNFFDLKARDRSFSSENDRYAFISTELDRIVSTYECPVVCTAELRKLNGNRRPIMDDIRETIKIVYKAKAIMLVYNEVGIRGQAADVYWCNQGSTFKNPILEVKVAKNKLGEFKGRLFYEFWPEQSYLSEVPKQGAQIYNQRISA